MLVGDEKAVAPVEPGAPPRKVVFARRGAAASVAKLNSFRLTRVSAVVGQSHKLNHMPRSCYRTYPLDNFGSWQVYSKPLEDIHYDVLI
jgi:hypothetical protein